jgi:kynurenine formamidase
MKVIDLVHTISENMPVYPGTEGTKLIFSGIVF